MSVRLRFFYDEQKAVHNLDVGGEPFGERDELAAEAVIGLGLEPGGR